MGDTSCIHCCFAEDCRGRSSSRGLTALCGAQETNQLRQSSAVRIVVVDRQDPWTNFTFTVDILPQSIEFMVLITVHHGTVVRFGDRARRTQSVFRDSALISLSLGRRNCVRLTDQPKVGGTLATLKSMRNSVPRLSVLDRQDWAQNLLHR